MIGFFKGLQSFFLPFKNFPYLNPQFKVKSLTNKSCYSLTKVGGHKNLFQKFSYTVHSTCTSTNVCSTHFLFKRLRIISPLNSSFNFKKGKDALYFWKVDFFPFLWTLFEHFWTFNINSMLISVNSPFKHQCKTYEWATFLWDFLVNNFLVRFLSDSLIDRFVVWGQKLF